MKTSTLFIAAVLALGVAGVASSVATRDMPEMTAPGQKSGKGVGVIKAIDAKAGTSPSSTARSRRSAGRA